jgi:hypothetical protein
MRGAARPQSGLLSPAPSGLEFLFPNEGSMAENGTSEAAMNETASELCGKCGTDIDPTRRVDFTLRDGTRVCEPCFIKGNAQVARETDRFYRH